MLNKRGWGLKEMILLSGILVIFLVIAIYYVVSLYHGIGEEVTNSSYYELEERLENQAKIYLSDYYNIPLTSEKITISRAILRSYNLDVSLIDSLGNACSGYVVAYKTMGVTTVNGYIKCNDYQTVGYEEGMES